MPKENIWCETERLSCLFLVTTVFTADINLIIMAFDYNRASGLSNEKVSYKKLLLSLGATTRWFPKKIEESWTKFRNFQQVNYAAKRRCK